MTMKHLLAALLALVLLTGCGSVAPVAPEHATAPETVPTAPAGLWETEHPLEEKTAGAVHVYHLPLTDVTGMFTLGENVVVVSGDDATTLTRLVGNSLYIANQVTLDIALPAGAFQVTESTIAYHHPQRQQMVVLDAAFQEIRHIDLPGGTVITPLFSPDQDTLFYCTEDAVKAWDLSSGLHRTLREMTGGQRLTGVHRDGTVLQLETDSGTQLIDAADGSLLWQGTALTFDTTDDCYYAAFSSGALRTLVFGRETEAPTALTPADLFAPGTFLSRLHGCLTESKLSETSIRLDYYNLTTGCRQSCLPLENTTLLACDGTWEGWLYLLVADTEGYAVYRWDPTGIPINEIIQYTGAYHTSQDPDVHGLVNLQAKARTLGDAYCVEILLWDDTRGLEPWDYDWEIAWQVPLLSWALEELEGVFCQFPEGFLATTAENFSGLTICLVESIQGSPESGSLETADGVEYLDGTTARIALALDENLAQTLYHELYHVMETQLLNETTALDSWGNLNPGDFAYTYDYAANETRTLGSWLDEDIRCFVDQYSMSFPREDRARIFEYAATPGHEDLFAASPLQNKLKQLCIAIRDAYGLEKSREEFPWEQYLWQSIAYTS